MTIPEVLSTIEQRQFWERVYITQIQQGYPLVGLQIGPGEIADSALADWCERFGPKAAE